MLEQMIINLCSPTLAGLKTANLFRYRFSSLEQLQTEVSAENAKLNAKGVYIEILQTDEKFALLYTYRRKKLMQDLASLEVQNLLSDFGYESFAADVCLERLKNRLALQHAFPHEIGVFLSYPLSDVLGFIEHGGKNYKYCGFWKVYGDERKSRSLFEKFEKCTRVYVKCFASGTPISKLTIAA